MKNNISIGNQLWEISFSQMGHRMSWPNGYRRYLAKIDDILSLELRSVEFQRDPRLILHFDGQIEVEIPELPDFERADTTEGAMYVQPLESCKDSLVLARAQVSQMLGSIDAAIDELNLQKEPDVVSSEQIRSMKPPVYHGQFSNK